jgi:alanyl-tRNA synthetase
LINRDTAYRVIADHLRTLTFAIADGAIPSNEGRGYVLRRILRRAVRYGMQTLNASPGFFASLVPIIIQRFGNTFPELIEKETMIQTMISHEEISFASLLQRGVQYFHEMITELQQQQQEAKSALIIPGEKAFFLYDTLGFPIDLTQLMAQEIGYTVDMQGIQHAMDAQKERSRQALKEQRLAGRTALVLGAEEVASLNKQGIPATEDDKKYLSYDEFIRNYRLGSL